MLAPETQKVMSALMENGGAARFVGGCVRNALANRPVLDIDIATPLPPEEVIARLTAHKIGYAPTGLKHGTVTAIADGHPFEITTLRRDVATDGRHAEVAFTDDWQADAARRDFTFNAMYATTEGELFDPFGGVEDLRAGRVRFVGDAAARIGEDVLRILRFFRFYAHFGKGAADAEIAQVGLERRGVHGDERVDFVPRGENFVARETELVAADARERAGRSPNFGREVGQSADVISEGGGNVRELSSRELHSVAAVPAETNDNGFERLQRPFGGRI